MGIADCGVGMHTSFMRLARSFRASVPQRRRACEEDSAMVIVSGELVMSFSKKVFRRHFSGRHRPVEPRTSRGCDPDHGTAKYSVETPALATIASRPQGDAVNLRDAE